VQHEEVNAWPAARKFTGAARGEAARLAVATWRQEGTYQLAGRFLAERQNRTRHGSGIMTNKIPLFIAAALALVSVTASQAQQSEPSPRQPLLQRGDPATVGAGPTSSAPGQTNYDPPKGASVTTDDRGVTTTNSAGGDSKSKGVRPDRGNESYDAVTPDGK
jgi:hypothetical protein